MYPEDRVLVGVINRTRDLDVLRRERWYRIPERRIPEGFSAEYLGFFLSRAFGAMNGAIHYFAPCRGFELMYRKDLLPDESGHPRALDRYLRVQVGELLPKEPPIRNVGRRRIGFIYTTWDRFVNALTIGDLYLESSHYVDRVFYSVPGGGRVRTKDGNA